MYSFSLSRHVNVDSLVTTHKHNRRSTHTHTQTHTLTHTSYRLSASATGLLTHTLDSFAPHFADKCTSSSRRALLRSTCPNCKSEAAAAAGTSRWSPKHSPEAATQHNDNNAVRVRVFFCSCACLCVCVCARAHCPSRVDDVGDTREQGRRQQQQQQQQQRLVYTSIAERARASNAPTTTHPCAALVRRPVALPNHQPSTPRKNGKPVRSQYTYRLPCAPRKKEMKRDTRVVRV